MKREFFIGFLRGERVKGYLELEESKEEKFLTSNPCKSTKTVKEFTAGASIGMHTFGRLAYCLKEELENIEYSQHFNKELLQEVIRLEEAYHLNGLEAGTDEQTKALKGIDCDYSKACEILKEKGLYEDRGYRYGQSWLYRPIPEKDLIVIENFIKG